MDLSFGFSSGTNFSSGALTNAWAAHSATNICAGQTNLADAVGNYWEITGVQLEVGDVATPFEHESYGQTLAKCQRYYYEDPLLVGVGYTSTKVSRATATHSIEMRASPSISMANTAQFFNGSQVITATGVITSNHSTVSGVSVDFTVGSNSVTNAATCYIDLTSKRITVDAEL